MPTPSFIPTRREFIKAAALTSAAAVLPEMPTASTLAAQGEAVANIGSRLELFTDHFLIERMDGTALRLHEPRPAGVAIQYDRPWEGAFCGYVTVIKDGGTYRLYYRGSPDAKGDNSHKETTCYAESKDGVNWTKPNLGLFEVHGTRDNNCILANLPPLSHNFSPFLDTRPGVPADERFKAVSGSAKSGLMAFVSGDGIHWRKLREEPIFRKGAFDSQNVAFWSEAEQSYLLYFRVFTGGTVDEKKWQPKGYRTVSRSMSKDFLNWSEPQRMTFGDTPPEHLYTNATHPYFRAPHLYIAIPMRFMPGRKVLTDAQSAALGVNKGYVSDCAEAVLMSSRGGTRYDRTFMEALIRPGTDPGNWASRAGLTALGVVPTSATEMSLYKQAHYAQPTAHLLRYTVRTDGFSSVNAPYRGGELLTKPLKFSGKELVLNFATGAAGGIRVEIQDTAGQALPGFALTNAQETIGDDVERVVAWKNGSDVSALAGKPVRLRVAMKDADLFSLRFR